MGLPSGTHDPRTFRHLAKLAKDGSVIAIVEVADGYADPIDGEQSRYVEVTDLYPYDFAGVRVDLAAAPLPPVFVTAPPLDAPALPDALDTDALAAYDTAVKAHSEDVQAYEAAKVTFEGEQQTFLAEADQFTKDLQAQLKIANKVRRG